MNLENESKSSRTHSKGSSLASKFSLQSFFIARAAACLVLQLREITNHEHTLLELD